LAFPTASWGGGASPRGGGLAGDEGRGGSAGLWGDLSGREGWGGRWGSSGGGWVGAGAPEGGGPRQSGSAAALINSDEELSAAESNTKVGRGRERFLTSRRAPGTPRRRRWRNGGPRRRWRTFAAARRTAGERGQRGIGRERGNWGASRVADVGAELTGAKGAAERKWGRGRGRVGFGVQVARGGSVPSSTRDVGAEKAGARSSVAVTRGRRG
jgi:hypothetical protein